MKNKSINLTSKHKAFSLKHLLTPLFVLLTFSITSTMNTVIAGGRTGEPNLMDRFLQKQSNSQTQEAPASTDATMNSATATNAATDTDTTANNALVFSRGDTGVDTTDFNTNFSLNKTLTQIRNTSKETATDNSNAQLLSSLLNTLTTTSKTNGFVNIPLGKRTEEAKLNSTDLIDKNMLPTAIFNRFDLSSSSGKHCGEYRIVYHKKSDTSGRFFLIFEARYPNPKPNEGLAGCFAVADFWQKIGQKTKAQALVELEKFFYQGLQHDGVNLPAAINFAHYTHGTGQVRSNQFVDSPWQLREFKTDIDANGKTILVADTVKNNPLAELFANEKNSDSSALKASRIYFNNDFNHQYIDNLLAPEKHSSNPNASSIINGFSLNSNNQYNEFQSNSNSKDNTASPSNTTLNTAISNKLTKLSSYTPEMIRNRAEAMSCGGCHQNSNNKEIAPNIHWPNSAGFVHVTEEGELSKALTKQFLPARSSLLENYLQEACGPACQLGSASSVGGEVYQCVLKFDGSVECWGSDKHGETTVPNGLVAKQIAVGYTHSCALKINGTVECWGDDRHGETTVPNGLVAKQVAAGGQFSCALKMDNTVECWGGNNSEKTTVPNGLVAKQIALGLDHACAIKLDDTLKCWGGLPKGSPSQLIVKRVALGNEMTCAIKLDGSVQCWEGGLGNHGFLSIDMPNGLIAKKIAVGDGHACALRLNNTVTCWGLNIFAQAEPPEGLMAKEVVVGGWRSCALKLNNTVKCWGLNLGDPNSPRGLIAKQL
ncbi:hypothetical protein [uncultured Gammaproteobacteria bacterium]|jgi:hypothetical protein|nr:hypothetical protein [uncultured Gammaproteobacteria bacterium]